ncbi:MAG: MCE family protein [Acidimicrobiales bacterium]
MTMNLIAFFAVAIALVGYGFFDLLGDPFSHQPVVTTTFHDASGLEPNFGVVLDGVVVGSVQSVQLTKKGAKVAIALRPEDKVPSNVVASIGLANDLGEQQLQLTPTGRSTGEFLHNGSVVPAQPNGVPVQVGKVIGTASRLLKSIGVKSLNSLLATLGEGLSGQGQNLKTIMTASQQFSGEFLAFQQQFKALLANSTPVLNGISSDGPQLRQALAETLVLADVLDHHRYSLVRLLNNGANASQLATELVDATRPNLACVFHDFADISANGAEPQNLSNLSVGLATNEWFFGAVDGISPTGPAKSLFAGDPYNPNQEWLRTRLFIPPGSPPASQYPVPTSLNPSMPGAACRTEFGNGVGPATQLAAQFPVAGTRTDPPSSSEAVVRGGGDPSGTQSGSKGTAALRGDQLSSLEVPAGHPSSPAGAAGWIVLLIAAVGGLLLLAPHKAPRYLQGGSRRPHFSHPDRKDPQ